MNLYRISQTDNHGYDTFSDAIVLAEDAKQAAQTHPNDYLEYKWDSDRDTWYVDRSDGSRFHTNSACAWASADRVKVEFLGVADARFVTMNQGQSRVICASFHAG